MADDVTNTMLLEHIQAMKYELQQQIADVKLRQLTQAVSSSSPAVSLAKPGVAGSHLC